MPPRAWAKTLKALNNLGYEKLIPGHGKVLDDTSYVNLNIEAAHAVADQRDKLVADGVPMDEIAAKLDLTMFKDRFIKDIPLYQGFYDGYFAGPLKAAAVKELSGERMVEIIPRDDVKDK